MSFVLLWQPSDCIDLLVIDYAYIFVLFSENKYDDDDDDDDVHADVQLIIL